MRKLPAITLIATTLVIVLIGLWKTMYEPIRTKDAPWPHARLPQLAVGQIDVFGERPMPEKPKPLSEQEFRKRFENADIQALIDAATVTSLRERFGEPVEYSESGTLYSRDELPASLEMRYPTGVIFRIIDHAVAKIDISQPGYFFKGGIQVGASIEEVYRVAGAPEKTGKSSAKEGFSWGPGVSGRYEFPPRYLDACNAVKMYRPDNSKTMIRLVDDKVEEISYWREVHQSDWRKYDVKFRDTSKSIGYMWSKGSKCREGLEQLGSALIKYSNRPEYGPFPALSAEPGRFSFDAQALVPAFLDNPELLHCPAVKEANEPNSPRAAKLKDVPDYRYFGYFLMDEREGIAFLAAYYDHVTNKQPFEERLPIPDRASAGTMGFLVRLSQGFERYYCHDIGNPSEGNTVQGLIPLLVEFPGNHGVPGGHVLYMDGHVEWLPYPGPFPMTPAFIEGVKAVEERLRAKTAGK